MAAHALLDQVQRAIYALQISAGFRWKFYLQLASIMLSTIIAGLGVRLFGGGNSPMISVLAVGILAGYVAPLALEQVQKALQKALTKSDD